LQTEKLLQRSGEDAGRATEEGSTGSWSCARSGVSLGGGGASSAKARGRRWKVTALQVAGRDRWEQAMDLCTWNTVENGAVWLKCGRA
jgi:hypothetical protein